MNVDFSFFFKKYESLREKVDKTFLRVQSQFPDCVKCQSKCSDCCFALFDITLIEAIYVNHHFNRVFNGNEKKRLFDKSSKADRKVYKIKKDAYKQYSTGKSEEEIVTKIAKERIRCPFLNEQNLCDFYDFRPITCRLYGIPTSSGNISHTCGISGFTQGQKYPTVNFFKIQEQLYEISAELLQQIKSKHNKMADIIVPLSMAILTDYNEEYLGIE